MYRNNNTQGSLTSSWLSGEGIKPDLALIPNYKIEGKQRDPLNTTPNIVCLIDLMDITYIGIHDLSRFKKDGSILLKITSILINLGTHTIQLRTTWNTWKHYFL